MSDPFERLRDVGPDSDLAVPDVSVLKSRARAIERRRYVGLSAGAVAVVMIAVLGIVVSGPGDLVDRESSTGAALDSGEERAASEGRTSGVRDAPSKKAARSTGRISAEPQSDTASKTTGGALTGAAAVSVGRSDTLKATLEVTEEVVPRGAEFTLKVCNEADYSVQREFSDGQRYDFEVKREGELVWRWSEEMFFTQEVGSETWKANECREWIERWDGMTNSGGVASSGSYEATGELSTSPPLKTVAEEFCLDLC